jgi:hypothetical protein
MNGEGRDHRTMQRGIDEAYACRDMLASSPVRATLFARVTGRISALLRGAGSRIPREGSNRRLPAGTITETMR